MASSEITHSPTDGISRRTLFCGALLAAVTGSAISMSSAAAASIPTAKGVKKLAGGKFQVPLASNPTLKKVGTILIVGESKGVPVALVSGSGNSFKAMALICTHAGGPLELMDKQLVCGWHGSVFGLDGKVKISPAKTALPSIKVSASATSVTVG
ncbi:MAG: Rieske (2Fe-2S) protein [Actinomycetes bacterium]